MIHTTRTYKFNNRQFHKQFLVNGRETLVNNATKESLHERLNVIQYSDYYIQYTDLHHGQYSTIQLFKKRIKHDTRVTHNYVLSTNQSKINILIHKIEQEIICSRKTNCTKYNT